MISCRPPKSLHYYRHIINLNLPGFQNLVGLPAFYAIRYFSKFFMGTRNDEAERGLTMTVKEI
jgi:hypothetical protein